MIRMSSRIGDDRGQISTHDDEAASKVRSKVLDFS